MAANGRVSGRSGTGGGDGELAAPEDAEWATMAEEDKGEGPNGGVDANAKGDPAGDNNGGVGGGDGDGEEEEEDERASAADEAGREHLVLLCRALLTCSASRTERVRKSAALLLADADVPGALDALQVIQFLSRFIF